MANAGWREGNGDFAGLAGVERDFTRRREGYCAIVDGVVHVGVGESTPLLDEARSKGGYFFRQYPLVDQGVAVSNKPQNKTIRKALCEWDGQVFVTVSSDRLTLDEFSRTLAGLGVDNAIYLVGSEFAYGWSVDRDGKREEFGSEDLRPDTGSRAKLYGTDSRPMGPSPSAMSNVLFC